MILQFSIPIVPYAAILALMGLVSIYFTLKVIVKQHQLAKLPIASKIIRFRERLHRLAGNFLVGNILLFLINVFTMLVDTDRPDTISMTSFIYSIALHALLITASYTIYRLYKLAEDVDSNDKESHHTLINDDESN